MTDLPPTGPSPDRLTSESTSPVGSRMNERTPRGRSLFIRVVAGLHVLPVLLALFATFAYGWKISTVLPDLARHQKRLEESRVAFAQESAASGKQDRWGERVVESARQEVVKTQWYVAGLSALGATCLSLALSNSLAALALWRDRPWARRVSAAHWIFYGILLAGFPIGILAMQEFILRREVAAGIVLSLLCFTFAVRLLWTRSETPLRSVPPGREGTN